MFKVPRSLIKNSRKIPNKEKGMRISLSFQKKSCKLTIIWDTGSEITFVLMLYIKTLPRSSQG